MSSMKAKAVFKAMEDKPKPTKVIFRTWHGGGVIALFPDVDEDTDRRYVSSYEHIGQHGSASYSTVMALTTPTTPDGIKPLKAELESLGYVLAIRKRKSYKR